MSLPAIRQQRKLFAEAFRFASDADRAKIRAANAARLFRF